MQISLLVPLLFLLEVQGRRRIAIGPKLPQLLVDFVLILPICPFQVQARLFLGALRKQLEGGPMIFWLVSFLLAAAGFVLRFVRRKRLAIPHLRGGRRQDLRGVLCHLNIEEELGALRRRR